MGDGKSLPRGEGFRERVTYDLKTRGGLKKVVRRERAEISDKFNKEIIRE